MPNIIYTSEKVLPYVYIGTHKETNQFYIGYRSANKLPSHIDLGTKYFTSSKTIKKIGFDNFDWVILAEFFNKKDAFDFEQFLIKENWNNKLKLNKKIHGNNFIDNTGFKHSNETKQKMKLKATGRYHSEESKNKLRGENHYSTKESFIPQAGEKNGMYGKRKELNPCYGRTKETHEYLKTLSQKLSGENNPRYGKPGTMLGKKLTKEQRSKIGNRYYPTGKELSYSKSIFIGNKEYYSYSECSKETNLSLHFIRKIIKCNYDMELLSKYKNEMFYRYIKLIDEQS